MAVAFEELEKKVENEGVFEEKTRWELSSQFLGVNVIPTGAIEIKKGKVLGQGAYGKVYEGNWMGKNVALKQIDESSPGMEERLKKIYDEPLKPEEMKVKGMEIVQWEILRSSALSHPNIVQFYGVYCQGDAVYQVMELCSGTLKSALANLSWSLRWQWALEIAQGLAYIHKQGVLHRDLKADNILISKDNRIRLADFGLAQADALAWQSKEPPPVRAGHQNSTFMAPELVEYHFKFLNAMPEPLTVNDAPGLVFDQQQKFYIIFNDGSGTIKKTDVISEEVVEKLQLRVFFEKQGSFEKHYSKKTVFLAADNEVILYIISEYNQIDIKTLSTKETEIYALGLLFWQLVTGKTPRRLLKTDKKREQKKQYDEKVLEDMKDGQREPIPDDCPPEFRKLIKKCWRLDPNKRPSAEDIVKDLNHLGDQFRVRAKAEWAKWIKLCEKIDALIHPARSEILKYIEPYVTKHPIMEDLDTYWSRLESQGYLDKEPKKFEEEIKINNEQTLIGNPPLELTSILENFLQASERSTLVLLGEAGLGKTLSTYQIADQLLSRCWKYLKNPQGMMPYYPLLIRPMLNNWSYSELRNALPKACDDLKFSLTEAELHQARWLIIVDGYDECQTDMAPDNLPKQLGLERFPNAKLLVTCRPNTVPTLELQNRFALKDNLIIRYFLPFNIKQMLGYLKGKLCWDSNIQTQYQQKFQQTHALRVVLRNPFVLSLLVQSWETVSQKDFNQLNRWQIYQGFVEHLIINSAEFLLSKTLRSTLRGGHSTLLESFNAFAADIAFSAFQKKSVSLDVKTAAEQLSQAQLWLNLKEQVTKDSQQRFSLRQKQLTEQTQRRALLNEQDYSQIMCWCLQRFEAGCPLKNKILSFGFMHKSFFEYFISRRIVDLRSRGHDDIVKLGLSLLNTRSLQEEPATLQFIAEAWQESETQVLKEPFFDIVRASRGNPQVAQAAANAITILNYARVAFLEMDFSDIQIPGADLSGGIFWGSNFSDANLSKANVQDANFRGVNFQNTDLFEVQPGERPYFKVGGEVQDFVFSPNNECIACATDKTIEIYTVENREWARAFRNTSGITSIAWSPTKQLLASGSYDGTVKVWKAKNGAVFRESKQPKGSVNIVAWSPDGDWLASGGSGDTPYGHSDGYKIQIWEVMSGTVKSFFEHAGSVQTIAWSPNGKLLASASKELETTYGKKQKYWGYKMYIWEAMDGKVFKDLSDVSGNTGHVNSVAWSSKGEWLASGHSNHTIKIWAVENGRVLKILQGHTDSVTSVAWSSNKNEKMLASGSDDKTVRVWAVETGTPLKISMGHTDKVSSVVWFSDGKTLASGSKDKTIRVWDMETSIPPKVSMGHTGTVNCISWSPDGKKLASGSSDCTVHILETASGAILKMTKHTGSINSVAWSPYGPELALGSSKFRKNNQIHICDAVSSQVIKTINGMGETLNSISWSADKKWLASGSGVIGGWSSSADNALRIWEVTSGKMLKVVKDGAAVTSTAWFSHPYCGMELLACGLNNDHAVFIFHILKRSMDFISDTLKGHKASVTSVAWFPKKADESLAGLGLASGSADHTIRLWEVIGSGKELSVLRGHRASVTSIAWSPNGQWLASGSTDETVRIWKIDSRECVKEMNFFKPVNAVSWNGCYSDLIAVGYGQDVCSFSFITSQEGYKAKIQWLHTAVLRLNFIDANIKQTRGLSNSQYKLLEQLGAKGKPFINSIEIEAKKIKVDDIREDILNIASELLATPSRETGVPASRSVPKSTTDAPIIATMSDSSVSAKLSSRRMAPAVAIQSQQNLVQCMSQRAPQQSLAGKGGARQEKTQQIAVARGLSAQATVQQQELVQLSGQSQQGSSSILFQQKLYKQKQAEKISVVRENLMFNLEGEMKSEKQSGDWQQNSRRKRNRKRRTKAFLSSLP